MRIAPLIVVGISTAYGSRSGDVNIKTHLLQRENRAEGDADYDSIEGSHGGSEFSNEAPLSEENHTRPKKSSSSSSSSKVVSGDSKKGLPHVRAATKEESLLQTEGGQQQMSEEVEEREVNDSNLGSHAFAKLAGHTEDAVSMLEKGKDIEKKTKTIDRDLLELDTDHDR